MNRAEWLNEQVDLLFPDNDPDKRMRSFRRRDIEEIQFKVLTWRTRIVIAERNEA